MANQKLDEKLVKALPSPDKGMKFIRDSAVTGFGVIRLRRRHAFLELERRRSSKRIR